MDALLTGRGDKLVLKGEITKEMATSLMNDSTDASEITRMLVDIAGLLYTPNDTLLSHIDEQTLYLREAATMPQLEGADQPPSDTVESSCNVHEK